MAGLIEEIQRDALDPNVPVATLLRKVKVAAVKMQLGGVEGWVENELNGYKSKEDLPEYRLLKGRPMGLNPYQGWLPIVFHEAEVNKLLSDCSVFDAVPSLETTTQNHDPRDTLQKPFPAENIAMLNKILNEDIGQMGNHLAVSQLSSILSAVRNLVLDWSLRLEQAGIQGEGFTFSAQEKSRAQVSPVTYNIGSIGNFAGNLGAGNTSGDITVTSVKQDTLKRLVREVSAGSQQLVEAGANPIALGRAIDELRAENDKAEPNADKVQGALIDLRTAVSGAAGNLAASGVLALIHSMIS
ncbi:hypothetical protein [Tianweitania sp.]|uniref:AbiTii domain-containing protein n=1 Tax=Tianweitania sp. TaxID=2021634 RepID=UPI0028A0E031|nr:hypothetical protein [Tianweitania sp.]